MSRSETPTAPAGPARSRLEAFNLMHPIRWVPPEAKALLDVGCNVGSLLNFVRQEFPGVALAGVEVNAEALEVARRELPGADLHHAGAEALPFADRSFDCVTCIEVLEHVPADRRAGSLAEIGRVLRPGGRLILRTPHLGLFSVLDANNLRFRMPWLYRRLVGRGGRDAGYDHWSSGAGVIWHHHFTKPELLELAGEGWEVEASRTGGLLLFPLADLASWPFYRKGHHDHPACRALARLMTWDIGIDYGRASFDILLVLRRP